MLQQHNAYNHEDIKHPNGEKECFWGLGMGWHLTARHGAARADLSISDTANLLGYLCIRDNSNYTEYCEKKKGEGKKTNKPSSEQQVCGWKRTVDEKGQSRIAKLV